MTDVGKVSKTELAIVESAMPEAWPDYCRDFALYLFAVLILSPTSRDALDKDTAAKVAVEQADMLRREFGGLRMYLSAGHHLAARARAKAIAAEFNSDRGNPIAKKNQLAKKYGLSIERVQQILRDDRKKRQGQ